MIELRGIHKRYTVGNVVLPVLKEINLDIEQGEFVAIMGASGSGKTTLLNIIGCLDTLDKGGYKLNGQSIEAATELELARLRAQHIGFVFQLFNLIPRIDALRNVELPLIYSHMPQMERRQRAAQALSQVAMEERVTHMPNQLSGGQQQRVAIARALVNEPRLLIADEPTGSLDSHTGKEIMELFKQLHAEGMTIVMVTHETEIAAYAHRIITLKDGCLAGDRRT